MRNILLVIILMVGIQSQALMWVDECSDINGVQVSYQSSPSLGQAGEGVILNAMPVILVNHNLMANYSNGVRQFILAHECAHQKLGHIVQHHYTGVYPQSFEFDADCSAIQVMRNSNLLNGGTLNQIYSFLSGLRADAAHPSSDRRITYIQQCLAY